MPRCAHPLLAASANAVATHVDVSVARAGMRIGTRPEFAHFRAFGLVRRRKSPSRRQRAQLPFTPRRAFANAPSGAVARARSNPRRARSARRKTLK
jgi:hypothetical protein